MQVFTNAEWAAELKAAGVDTDPDPSPNVGATRLRHYWTRGEGAAKIRWGVDGDFKRCVAQLRKYVGARAEGLCNVYHRSATGHAPGEGPHAGGKWDEVELEWKVEDAPDIEFKRKFTAEQRQQMAKDGRALPDGSFPIDSREDITNALSLLHHATDKAKAKRHIKKRAAALGVKLPEDFGEKSDEPDWLDSSSTMTFDDIDTKDNGGMHIEYKSVGVSGVEVVDEEKGIVEAVVSVTGVVDNVKDLIEPGAYEKSLSTRIPKGVWSHSWDTPVARTLDVKELMPGDSNLPSQLPDGRDWPSEAGALKVKTQFNLETQRGREAYSDVVFFGPQQEWSIGYQVPVGAGVVDSKTGQRRIKSLELYEYSPVLFGAMPAARTASVKDAQIAYKSVMMPEVEFKEWRESFLGDIDDKARKPKKPRPGEEDEYPVEEDEDLWEDESYEDERQRGTGRIGPRDEDDEEDAEDEYEEDRRKRRRRGTKGLTAYEREVLVKTGAAIAELLGGEGTDFESKAYHDYEDDEYTEEDSEDEGDEEQASSLSDVVEEHADALGDSADEVRERASEFDSALDEDDNEAVEEAGNAILDTIDVDDPDDAQREAIQAIARAIADLAPDGGGESETPADEDDTEEKSEKIVRLETKELDAFRASLLDGLRK